MSDPMVPGLEAVGEEDLLLVHDGQLFEVARNGGARATREEVEAIP